MMMKFAAILTALLSITAAVSGMKNDAYQEFWRYQLARSTDSGSFSAFSSGNNFYSECSGGFEPASSTGSGSCFVGRFSTEAANVIGSNTRRHANSERSDSDFIGFPRSNPSTDSNVKGTNMVSGNYALRRGGVSLRSSYSSSDILHDTAASDLKIASNNEVLASTQILNVAINTRIKIYLQQHFLNAISAASDNGESEGFLRLLTIEFIQQMADRQIIAVLYRAVDRGDFPTVSLLIDSSAAKIWYRDELLYPMRRAFVHSQWNQWRGIMEMGADRSLLFSEKETRERFQRIVGPRFNVSKYDTTIGDLLDRQLLYAADNGMVQRAGNLLFLGADVHYRQGMSLFTAIRRRNYPMVELFLRFGAETSSENFDVLSFAVANGYDEIVYLLLSYGADPLQVKESTRKAAKENGKETSVMLLNDPTFPFVDWRRKFD